MGSNFSHQFLTRTPFNVLQVSSLLMKNISKDKFTGKYAYLYEELVKVQTQKIDSSKRTKYSTLLEFLAYEAYSNCESRGFDTSSIMIALDNHHRWSESFDFP